MRERTEWPKQQRGDLLPGSQLLGSESPPRKSLWALERSHQGLFTFIHVLIRRIITLQEKDELNRTEFHYVYLFLSSSLNAQPKVLTALGKQLYIMQVTFSLLFIFCHKKY